MCDGNTALSYIPELRKVVQLDKKLKSCNGLDYLKCHSKEEEEKKTSRRSPSFVLCREISNHTLLVDHETIPVSSLYT